MNALRVSFFFQAEDGIRDLTVTGVQTCALPISVSEARRPAAHHVEWELRRIVRKAAARARLSGTDSRRGQSPVSFISARKRFPVPWLFHPLVLRSEEHTSELQSQSNLVCRLLLEKKKRKSPAYSSVRNTECTPHTRYRAFIQISQAKTLKKRTRTSLPHDLIQLTICTRHYIQRAR